ncbi:MAG: hypothetical protein EBY77_01710, partial [Rhodobacteraceae bacterium]|nr:hypothetical protein [Paracoccaceae bacterium]
MAIVDIILTPEGCANWQTCRFCKICQQCGTFRGPFWVAEIDRTDRIPEYISHAFHVAQSGRPGPVVLALPEDMLSGQADVADVTQPAKPPEQTVAPSAVQGVLDDLAAAKNPMM